MGLENISNDVFYNKYYYPVRDNPLVRNKNAEFCIIRDIVLVLFIIITIMFFFTMIWYSNFVVEFIVSVSSYIIGVVACHKKLGSLYVKLLYSTSIWGINNEYSKIIFCGRRGHVLY